MYRFLLRPIFARVLALAVACAASANLLPAHAAGLTIANFGGANANAQAVAFQRPFAQRNNVVATAVEYDGSLSTIRAMLKKGAFDWDVVEVESTDLLAGCEAGLFESVDQSTLPHAPQLLPGSVQSCGVGAFVWSTVLAYDPTRFKDAPKSWQDFWDVAKFPGKRGMRAGPRYNLEFALMADGVPRDEVYRELGTEAGLARAIKKLNALRPYIVWWTSGAQPPKRLAAGEVVMSTAFNGRIAVANREDPTSRLEIAWPGAIYELDYWVIPKGTPRKDLARQYIAYATTEDAQLAFSREIPYGPTNMNAILKYDTGRHAQSTSTHQALVDLSMLGSELPSAPGNLRKALAFNPNFWIKHGAAIEKRFAEAVQP